METPLAVIQWSISVIKVNFPLLPLTLSNVVAQFPLCWFSLQGNPTNTVVIEGTFLEIFSANWGKYVSTEYFDGWKVLLAVCWLHSWSLVESCELPTRPNGHITKQRHQFLAILDPSPLKKTSSIRNLWVQYVPSFTAFHK